MPTTVMTTMPATTYPPVKVDAIYIKNGDNSSSGVIAVQINGREGTICDTFWDIKDADVICRYMGYISAISIDGKMDIDITANNF